jgi:Domain of unknown function (DUF305)
MMAPDANARQPGAEFPADTKNGTGVFSQPSSPGVLSCAELPPLSLDEAAQKTSRRHAIAGAVVINLYASKHSWACTALLFIFVAALAMAGRHSVAHSVEPNPNGSAAASGQALEMQYLAASAAAMAKMMRDMQMNPTGDVDRDFVAQMIPHHQGAIDMAVALLRAGGNEQLTRLAQEIIVTQQQEIAAMRLAIGEAPASGPAAH